jgi:type I restriction enzyme S subunit
MQENNLLSLSFGRIVRKDINKNEGLLPESFETYQIVEKGDIVFRLTDLQNDQRSLRTALVPERGIITSAYVAVRVKGVHASFLAYQLRSYDLQKVFYSMGGGLRQTMKYEDLRWLPLLVPPAKEQVSIAAFLDRETTRIDALIEKKTRFIELLREKRQALITQAVTKGLDPNVSIKDSTIEWMGLVPAHWAVTRLKFLATVQTGVAKGKDLRDRKTIEVPYLRVANVQDGYLDLSDVDQIEIESADLERYLLRDGDVLMNEGGDFDKLGRGHVWNDQLTPCVHQNHVFAVRPHSVTGEWLSAYTSSRAAQYYFMGRAKQTTNLASISSSNLMELPVPVPPPEEQHFILAAAASRLNHLDTLAKTTQRSLDLLKEHRSALITAAVTGQIDLREPAPRDQPKPASSPRCSKEAAAHVEDPSRV